MFKTVIKEVENQKALFYYQEKERAIEFISIQAYGEDDYGYWQSDISKSDLDLTDLENSLFDWIYINPPLVCEGGSSRGTLTDLLDELVPLLPTLKEDLEDVQNELLIC